MMRNWRLCVQTLCVTSIVFVDFPANVDSSIFENIEPLDSSSSAGIPDSTEFRNEKLRQIILSYTPSPPPPVFNNSKQVVLQPSISSESSSNIHKPRPPPSRYPMMPPLPSIPPDVEVFNPSTYPGAKPDVDDYPPAPFYPPEQQPPVFRPPHGGILPPFRPPHMPPDDVEIFDPSANKPMPIPLYDIKGLQLFVPFNDNDAVLFESRESTRNEEKIESKEGESNDKEDRIDVSGQLEPAEKQLEESQNKLEDTRDLVNSTMKDDDLMAPVINKIKDIIFNKVNATFPRIYHEKETKRINVTKNEIPIITGEENSVVESPTIPEGKPSTTETPCEHLFDLIGRLMKIKTNEKTDQISYQDDSAVEPPFTFYSTYYTPPQLESEWEPEIGQPITDYVYHEFVEVPILYAFDHN